jgi:exodeoxyribonuclease V alpha subunit
LEPGPQKEATELVGTIERFTFRNPDTGFAVARFAPDGGSAIAVVGPLAQLVEGQRLRVHGQVTEHPRFGRQVEVTAFEPIMPKTTEGIAAYLGSKLVKGIGPRLAERLVATFGERTLEIIESEPERLREVKGIGSKKLAELQGAVQANKDVQQVLVFLRAHGLGQGLALRIVKRLGRGAAALIQANPYRLADEVIGVGFKTADRLAQTLGIAPTSPERLQAGILHVLGKAAAEGHCFLPAPDLAQLASEELQCAPDAVSAQLSAVQEDGRVVIEAPPGPRVLVESEPLSVYPRALHQAESGVAAALDRVLRAPRELLPIKAPAALAWWERRSGLELPEGQRRAILRALEEPVSVITGGPGVGKTTIVRALVDVLAQKQLEILLAAPTGRAAKRLEESTGRPALTIHRLLEYQPGVNRFQRDAHEQLQGAMLVVDEASMLDVQLAYALFRAVPPGMRLVLVGDVDQLPAVGPGNVLRDVIGSGRVAVTALTEIFRQAEGSAIVRAAHSVLRGDLPHGGSEGSDFYFVAAEHGAATRALVRELVLRRIPRRFGLDPFADVQVLSPMYRGEAGADAINRDLQDVLNPGQPELERGNRTFRQGDKVMQIRNDYDLDLYNGDVGRILHVDKAAATLRVRFGERELLYPFSDLDQLVTAYAITVHRAQGSEYPAVVVPLATDHFMMLRRNLLYTAITRGRKLVVLVGSRKALATAVRNDQEAHRWSALAERLREQIRAS